MYLKKIWEYSFRLESKMKKIPMINLITRRMLYKIEAYIIKKYGLFDDEFYLNQRSDIKELVKNPLHHFLHFGWKENVSPSIWFDTEYYRKNNTDVAYNPVIHYLFYGELENRKPHPIFNPDYFRIKYNICDNNCNCLSFFILSGKENKSYYKIVFPHFERIDDTIIEDSEFLFLENDKHTVNLINNNLYEGNCYKAVNLFVEEYSKQKGIIPKTIKEKIYNFKSVKENAKIIYKESENVLTSMIENLPGYNKMLYYPEPYIANMNDVYVIGGTNLIVKDDYIYNDEIVEFSSSDYGVKAWNNLSRKEINNVQIGFLQNIDTEFENVEKGILISCTHDNNYFHWLNESIPMLLFIIECFNDYKDYPILIPETLHKNYLSVLDIIIKDMPNDVIKLKTNRMYHFLNLIIPSDLSRILDRYNGTLLKRIDSVLNPMYIRKLRDRICKCYEKPYRKLFLTRHSGTYRRLLNESEVETFLVKHGFEIIDLAGVTFEFQQELFSQAKVVIAPTGATMTNMLLSPVDSTFLVLYSDHEHLLPSSIGGKPCTLWDQLAQICEINLYQINGKRAYNREDLHDDFYIPVSLLESNLSNII